MELDPKSRICPNPKGNPKCYGTLKYSSIGHKLEADKRGTLCRSCSKLGKPHTAEHNLRISTSLSGVPKSPEHRKNLSISLAGVYVGEKSSFYGKHHTEETKRKIGKKSKGRRLSSEARAKISKANKGRKHTEAWIEEQRKRMEAKPIKTDWTLKRRLILSQRMTGRKLSIETREKMSKSQKEAWRRDARSRAPKGSRGVNGHFGGVPFRSSSELRFLIENQSIQWKNASTKEYSMTYVAEDKAVRLYFPDFFGDGKLVEVKPPNWKNTPRYAKNVELKREAAIRFCRDRGWTYLLVEMESFKKSEIFQMRKQGRITLSGRWERRYRKWLEGIPMYKLSKT